MNINSTRDCFIYLIQCSIHGIYPNQLNNRSVDLKELYELAASHHVENIIYLPLSKLKGFNESQAGAFMSEMYMHAVVKEAKQEVESARIMEAFEAEGIKHMPLKGYIIKNLYPSPDLRQSTDFDIYVPAEYNAIANEVMLKLGYESEQETVGRGMHDEYKLGNLMIAEVHKKLMAPEFPKWCSLCDELLKNIYLSEGYKCRFRFTKEDYYLYMQLHTIKHLKFSSTGVKSILDLWIYLKAYKDSLDWSYISKMLKKGGIEQIDKNLRELSDYWFENISPQNEIIYELADYIIGNGAFGTHMQYLSGRSTDESKAARLIRAFFLPYDDMIVKYPIVKRLPFLLPFAWVYRSISALINNKDDVKNMIATNNEINTEDAEKLSKFKKEIGL